MADNDHDQDPSTARDDSGSAGGGQRDPGDSLSDGDIRSLVGAMIDAAKAYNDEDLAPLRETATKYYQAEPYGNEEEGRSQVVTTEVCDTTQAILPSLMRIFTGPERAVEFKPRGDEDEAVAEQQTEYINFIIFEDNEGFIQHYSAFKDALVRKVGIFKWWWDDAEREEEAEYTGLSEENLQVLLADEKVEVVITAIDDTAEQTLYDAVVTYTDSGRVRFMATAPEEVSWNRSARTIEDARIVVHTREVRVDELLALGFSFDELETAIGSSSVIEDNIDADARVSHLATNVVPSDDEPQDWFTRPIRFDEAYVYLNLDGEEHGASLVKVSMVGDHHAMLEHEKVSHRPFSVICPIPEPHTLVGLSYADRTMDLQLIGSMVLRGTLDSLSLTLDPRTEAVDNMVNFDDLMNPEIGGVVRVTQPGMLREIAHRFVGGDTLPFMQYLGEIKENRTGQSKAAQGLDADALQSSTKAAVAATITAAQQQVEMVARLFAETGIKDLHKGLLRTAIEHQDFDRVVRIRGEYVTIDPRAWNATMDLVVNVGLGVGMPEERQNSLREILQKQESIFGLLGADNPLVGIHQYANTLHRLVELGGRKNSDQFFTRITKEEEEVLNRQAEEAKAKEPQGDPAAMMIAQAEMVKAQAAQQTSQVNAQIKQQEVSLKAEEVKLKDDRERDKQASDMILKIRELELKYGPSIDRAILDADVARERALLDSETRRDVATIQALATVESRGGSSHEADDA